MFIGKIQHSAKSSPLQKKGPCWKNYEMVGMKTKGGRKVPNCVPVKMEGDVLDGPLKKKRAKKEIRKTTKGKGRNFRTKEEGAGMTSKGVKEYRRKNPGSKLKTAVTGDVKPGSKAAKRRKSFCARSKGWTGERGKAARKRWKC